MFRRMSFVGLSVLVTASSVWAQAPGGVQRMHGQAVENRGVRPVAGPSQGSGAKKTGGVLGGLRGLFGGGGGGDSSDAPQRSTGAVPDAPIGQIGPMEDWSDLSHSPATRQGASQAPRTSPVRARLPKWRRYLSQLRAATFRSHRQPVLRIARYRATRLWRRPSLPQPSHRTAVYLRYLLCQLRKAVVAPRAVVLPALQRTIQPPRMMLATNQSRLNPNRR